MAPAAASLPSQGLVICDGRADLKPLSEQAIESSCRPVFSVALTEVGLITLFQSRASYTAIDGRLSVSLGD